MNYINNTDLHQKIDDLINTPQMQKKYGIFSEDMKLIAHAMVEQFYLVDEDILQALQNVNVSYVGARYLQEKQIQGGMYEHSNLLGDKMSNSYSAISLEAGQEYTLPYPVRNKIGDGERYIYLEKCSNIYKWAQKQSLSVQKAFANTFIWNDEMEKELNDYRADNLDKMAHHMYSELMTEAFKHHKGNVTKAIKEVSKFDKLEVFNTLVHELCHNNCKREEFLQFDNHMMPFSYKLSQMHPYSTVHTYHGGVPFSATSTNSKGIVNKFSTLDGVSINDAQYYLHEGMTEYNSSLIIKSQFISKHKDVKNLYSKSGKILPRTYAPYSNLVALYDCASVEMFREMFWGGINYVQPEIFAEFWRKFEPYVESCQYCFDFLDDIGPNANFSEEREFCQSLQSCCELGKEMLMDSALLLIENYENGIIVEDDLRQYLKERNQYCFDTEWFSFFGLNLEDLELQNMSMGAIINGNLAKYLLATTKINSLSGEEIVDLLCKEINDYLEEETTSQLKVLFEQNETETQQYLQEIKQAQATLEVRTFPKFPTYYHILQKANNTITNTSINDKITEFNLVDNASITENKKVELVDKEPNIKIQTKSTNSVNAKEQLTK